ncbi:MAG: flagellar biosynthetic protein FliO [Lachnospira sp.]|jgi:flagellar protein FliO/FliZ|uniref:flagellar biosynthetic protein FliO n=1 Tax=Lachnospira sp. TaxID=2049031 RepID=UPI002579F57A|nr:flagellar biosynthetic protein FliO [Lachnospira sp.]MBQ2472878.1 flagellar biosynthetic protein FliO [Lachnospira sp.]
MTTNLILTNSLDEIAEFVTLLVIFIIVIGITYFSIRIVGNIQKEKLGRGNIQILETQKVSNTKYIQIVRIGKKCFAIAICKDSISYLCEVDEGDLQFNTDSSISKSSAESFKAIIDKFKKDKPED